MKTYKITSVDRIEKKLMVTLKVDGKELCDAIFVDDLADVGAIKAQIWNHIRKFEEDLALAKKVSSPMSADLQSLIDQEIING